MTEIPTGPKVIKISGNEEAPMKIDESALQNTESDVIPSIIGAFSVDKERNYVKELSNLKYFKNMESLPIDLSQKEYEPKCFYEPYERLNQLTGFLQDRKAETTFFKDGNVQANIVSNSDVLIRIMTLNAPYDETTWYLDAFKYEDTIFLCKGPSNLEYINKFNFSNWDKKAKKTPSQNGYIFESYFQASDPNKTTPPGSSEKVIEAEEFNIVYKAEIGGLNVIYACEIDCVSVGNRRGLNNAREVDESQPRSSKTFSESEESKIGSERIIEDLNVLNDCNKREKNLAEVREKNIFEIKLTSESIFESMKKFEIEKDLIKSYLVKWWSSAILADKSQFVVGTYKAENSLVECITQKTTEDLFSGISQLKIQSLNNLKTKLKEIYERVNNELMNKPTHFCRFNCFSRFNNAGSIMFDNTYAMNTDMNKLDFVKHFNDIYNINNL